MTTLEIRPRKQFLDFINNECRYACLVAHRRAGKTFCVLQKMIYKAFSINRKNLKSAPARYAYIAPTRDQAKDIAWKYLKEFLSPIPGVVFNESELCCTLPNRATIRLYSGENYERMRGLYFDGVVLDEPADIPPLAWSTVIRACLSDYNGWAYFIGTPKGKNAFYLRHLKAKESDAWYSLVLKASESGIMPDQELQEMKDDPLISEDEYNQEYECDFSVGRAGAIYAKDIALSRCEGRVGPFPIDYTVPVHTTWDLGAPENTVVVYWQRVGLTWRVVDCDSGLDIKTAERVAHMKSKNYPYGNHFLPHDSVKRSSSGSVFAEDLVKAGLEGVVKIPQADHRAEETRARKMTDMFNQIWFHERVDGESGLLFALDNYRRKEHRLGGYIENKIVHDWSSHFADAFGYISEVISNRMLPEMKAVHGGGGVQSYTVHAGGI